LNYSITVLLDCAIIYILLIIEHNGDVSTEGLMTVCSNNLAAVWKKNTQKLKETNKIFWNISWRIEWESLA